LWDADKGKKLCSVDAGNSVTGLYWLADGKYLISTHDWTTNLNQVRLWYRSKIDGIYTLTAMPSLPNKVDGQRILYSAFSADRKLLLTATNTEFLVSWHINEAPMTGRNGKENYSSVLERTIR
jgi:WD40 repeat protein